MFLYCFKNRFINTTTAIYSKNLIFLDPDKAFTVWSNPIKNQANSINSNAQILTLAVFESLEEQRIKKNHWRKNKEMIHLPIKYFE